LSIFCLFFAIFRFAFLQKKYAVEPHGFTAYSNKEVF